MPNVKAEKLKEKKSSIDYPEAARVFLKAVLEASGEKAPSKLPAGLYIVATPIGNRGDITLRALVTLAQADLIAAEDTRTTGSLLSAYGLKKKLLSYTEHKDAHRTPEILRLIENGTAVALVSDAGLPLIADPGQRLAMAVLERGLDVYVIPGANAALTALAGSGLSTESFYFAGFLPPKTTGRKKALQELRGLNTTVILYEGPSRLVDSLADMAAIFGEMHNAVVARELTKLFEETRRGTLSELITHYSNTPAKGEIVVLLAPCDTDHLAPEIDLDAELAGAMKKQSLRDAVTQVTVATGLKKGVVYARALELSKSKP